MWLRFLFFQEVDWNDSHRTSTSDISTFQIHTYIALYEVVKSLRVSTIFTRSNYGILSTGVYYKLSTLYPISRVEKHFIQGHRLKSLLLWTKFLKTHEVPNMKQIESTQSKKQCRPVMDAWPTLRHMDGTILYSNTCPSADGSNLKDRNGSEIITFCYVACMARVGLLQRLTLVLPLTVASFAC